MNTFKRKQNFVLLELLIAFALVSTSILPFIRFPYKMMTKEIDLLFEMEMEKIADLKFMELQESLYKQTIPKELLFGDKQIAPYQTKHLTIKLSPKMQRSYIEKTYVTWEKQKQNEQGQISSALVKFKVKYFEKKNKKSHVLKTERLAIAEKKTP